jgi:hypothetical protein
LKYVELHAASAFSFLEGASRPEDLIACAKELELPAIALLDRDGVYGAPRFHMAAKSAGIRPHVGAEVSVEGFGNRARPPSWMQFSAVDRPARLSRSAVFPRGASRTRRADAREPDLPPRASPGCCCTSSWSNHLCQQFFLRFRITTTCRSIHFGCRIQNSANCAQAAPAVCANRRMFGHCISKFGTRHSSSVQRTLGQLVPDLAPSGPTRFAGILREEYVGRWRAYCATPGTPHFHFPCFDGLICAVRTLDFLER